MSRTPNPEEPIFLDITNLFKGKLHEIDNEGNDSKGSEACGEAVPGDEGASKETGSTTQIGELRPISSKRKIKS